MDEVYQVGTVVELVTPARFLFNAGRTPKVWNEKMLSDRHLKVMDYKPVSGEVFPGTDIKGGVAVTYRDTRKDYNPVRVFTENAVLKAIIEKVQTALTETSPMSDVALVATKFDLGNLEREFPETSGRERRMSTNVLSMRCFHEEKEAQDDVYIFGLLNGQRDGRYIASRFVDRSASELNGFKVVVPKADGTGQFGERLTTPEILPDQVGFTHSFLGIGRLSTAEEAEAMLKYIKSKFTRSMVSAVKVTQDFTVDKWRLVPQQDFTETSDIDWTQSIADIDQQLYKKYDLSDEEIEFIERHVKEMV